jgi:pyruvate/2-oxoglutarate dehydrogenase complex dihydrolipoamide acyltransferase (E2) component
MTMEVHMPGLGDMQEGTLLEWLAQPGARVESGQEIAVVDADKVTVDVHAPAGGYPEVMLDAGETAAVGELIARICEEPFK